MKRYALFALGLVVMVIAMAMLGHANVPTAHHVVTTAFNPDSLVGLSVGVGLIGALRSVSEDNNTFPVRGTVRTQYNAIASWVRYRERNRIIGSTAATYPLVAIATTATKVKTTNATVVLNAGVVNAVGASDDAWTLTGSNLAVGYSRKYLLLVSAADAFTVQASDDQPTASAASCAFSAPAVPADGLTIMGILQVDNATAAVFVPGTTALDTAGITDTYVDDVGDDSVFPFGQMVPT